MPHNGKLEPKQHAFPRLFGQIPLTIVKDYSQAIKVELVKHDDPTTMLDGTYDFVKATWSEDGREASRATVEEKRFALQQMLAGKTLQLGLETVQFIFRISGISRIDTHQIVRQRVGVTFSQQCSGDQFWHHHAVLLEPSITRSPFYPDYIEAALSAKRMYSKLSNDFYRVSLQAARSILPHCLETFLFMRVDLATLLFFYKKRIDDGSQTWQLNSIAQQMANEVIRVFPETEEAFNKAKGSFKFQVEASKDRKNSFSTGLYLPDPDEFEYHDLDFLYPKTKSQMHLIGKYSTPFKPKYFWGSREVNAVQYALIDEEYLKLNESSYGLNNEEIFLRAMSVNSELMKKLFKETL